MCFIVRSIEVHFLYPTKNSRPQIGRYCECFASGSYCDECSCANCHNNVENEDVRREAAECILERNPNAFKPKITGSPCTPPDDGVCKFQFSCRERSVYSGY